MALGWKVLLSWSSAQQGLLLCSQVSALRQELRRKHFQDVVVENYENLPGLPLVQ